MSNKIAVIPGAQLTNAAATYYTCPSLTKATVKNLTVCNSTASPHTYTLYRVPSGGTAGVTNIIVSARTIAAGETQTVYEFLGKGLLAGDFIQALADAGTAVTIDGAVLEVVS